MDPSTVFLLLITNFLTILVMISAGVFVFKDQLKDYWYIRQRRREVKRLKSKIEAYTTCSTLEERHEIPECPPKRLVIGLFGTTGVGKSSLINSILWLFNASDIRQRAPVGNQDILRGLSLHRNFYDVTRAIRLVDNRGMDKLTSEGTKTELKAQIDGKRGYAQIVETENNDRARDIDGECVHIGVFVIRGDVGLTDYNTALALVETFQRAAGQPPCAIITHKDRVVYQKEEETLQTLSQVGINKNDVYFVENTGTEKKDLELDTQLALLRWLERSIVDGDHSIAFRCKKSKEESQIQINREEINSQKAKEEKLRKEVAEQERQEEMRLQEVAHKRRQDEMKHEQEMQQIEIARKRLALELRQQEREKEEAKLAHEREMKEREYQQKLQQQQEAERQERERYQREMEIKKREIEKQRLKAEEEEKKLAAVRMQEETKAKAIEAKAKEERHKTDVENRPWYKKVFGVY